MINTHNKQTITITNMVEVTKTFRYIQFNIGSDKMIALFVYGSMPCDDTLKAYIEARFKITEDDGDDVFWLCLIESEKQGITIIEAYKDILFASKNNIEPKWCFQIKAHNFIVVNRFFTATLDATIYKGAECVAVPLIEYLIETIRSFQTPIKRKRKKKC